jgi:hypothetical protein
MGGNRQEGPKVLPYRGATEEYKNNSRNIISRQDERRDAHGQDSGWKEGTQIDIRRFSKQERKRNNKEQAKAPYGTSVIAVNRATW